MTTMRELFFFLTPGEFARERLASAPLEKTSRIERQVELLPARVDLKVVALPQEDVQRLHRPRAELLKDRMSVDVAVLDDQILAYGHHARVRLQFLQHMTLAMVGIKDHHHLLALTNPCPDLRDRLSGGGWVALAIRYSRMLRTVRTDFEIDCKHLAGSHQVADRGQVQRTPTIERACLATHVGV